MLYINDYGFTVLRICGLVYGLGGYILMLKLFYWAVKVNMPENTSQPVAGIVLRKSRAAVFVFKPCKTNDSTWELMFYGYSPLYQTKMKILAVEP